MKNVWNSPNESRNDPWDLEACGNPVVLWWKGHTFLQRLWTCVDYCLWFIICSAGWKGCHLCLERTRCHRHGYRNWPHLCSAGKVGHVRQSQIYIDLVDNHKYLNTRTKIVKPLLRNWKYSQKGDTIYKTGKSICLAYSWDGRSKKYRLHKFYNFFYCLASRSTCYDGCTNRLFV